MPVYYLSDLVGLALGLDDRQRWALIGILSRRSEWPWPESASSPAGAARTSPGRSMCSSVGRLARADEPGVVCSLAYKYMCSDPGQSLLRQKIASRDD